MDKHGHHTDYQIIMMLMKIVGEILMLLHQYIMIGYFSQDCL